MTQVKDSKAIAKEIDSIKVAGAKLDARIQSCGVDVLVHFAEHKDTGLVNRLYLALPKGARKTAMASWLMAYGAVSANADAKTKADMPFVYAKDKTTDPVGAAKDPWFDHKPDASPDQIFDLQKAVQQLIAKAGKATTIKGGTVDTLRALAKAAGIPDKDIKITTPAGDVKVAA